MPADSSLLDYEALIYRLLETETAQIYVYYADETPYLSITVNLDKRLWLVMASFDGVIETAFVVENPEGYMNRSMFRYIGTMTEVVK